MPMYEEMARRLAVTIEELRTLFEHEIVSCLRGGSDAKQLIAGRKDFVCWGFDESMRERVYFTTEEAKELFAYAEKTSSVIGQSGSDEKKGLCASPGKAQGTARIVATPAEGGRVGNGDILITYATTVDYLPAMKKASAIVTEVGGLTCHAAVVSREFGIPCVVGFKNAMAEFKDGDLIEVNADTGVVRKV